MRIDDLQTELIAQAEELRNHVPECQSKHPCCGIFRKYEISEHISMQVLLEVNNSSMKAIAYIKFSAEDEKIREIVTNVFKGKFITRILPDISEYINKSRCRV